MTSCCFVVFAGAVGRTFTRPQTYEVLEDWKKNSFVMPTFSNRIVKGDEKQKTLNPNDPEFKHSKWCYDTPGVVHPDQVQFSPLALRATYRYKILNNLMSN